MCVKNIHIYSIIDQYMIGRDLLGAETLTEVYFNLSAFFSTLNFAVQFNRISFKEPFAVHTWLPHCESHFSVWISLSHIHMAS